MAVKFWKELRRRQMFRLVGLYIVGAWLVIQVADIVFPAWGIPDSALRYMFFAAALCFPVALVFGWIFDIRRDGIYRTRTAGPDEIVETKLQRPDYAILAALLAVGLAVLLGSADKIQEEIESMPAPALAVERRDNSIAVLPFTNLDMNPDTGYFSDGITEEILHRLSTRGALHVLASNSSFAYRNSDESPSQISEKLGVRYLLQGSIRRDSDYVRVTARLIDHAGFQVWSQSFDRKLESIFAIQTEIASTVSSQIANEIVPLQELPAARTTQNMEAYNEYLIGNAYLDTRTAGWREKAVAAFRKAIDLDDGFAPPYAGLATAISVMSGFEPHWVEAEELAKKALELDPDLAQAHAILGLASFADSQKAEALLRRAIELDPSLGFAYNILHIVLQDQGLVSEAQAVLDKALEIDPLSPPIVGNVANREAVDGNFERAERLMLRLTSLPEPSSSALLNLSNLYARWGRFADAAAMAKDVIRLELAHGEPASFDQLISAYADLGMTEDISFWTDLMLSSSPDERPSLEVTYFLLRRLDRGSETAARLRQLAGDIPIRDGGERPFDLIFSGMINIHLKNYSKGVNDLESGLRLYQDRIKGPGTVSSIDIATLAEGLNPGLVLFLIDRLAFAYQEVDRPGDANRMLQALTDEFGMSSESIPKYPSGREDAALHFALQGDKQGALSALQQAAEIGWANYFDVTNDPAWAETIKAPEFQVLLDEVKAKIDEQRGIVEAADAEHDFRAEVERLLRDNESVDDGFAHKH
jgi:TolB-like protein